MANERPSEVGRARERRGSLVARMRRILGAVVLTVAGATACTPHPVGPARTFAKYEGKAVTTAEAALSSVETVRLAIATATSDLGFGPYLSVMVSEQEEAISN